MMKGSKKIVDRLNELLSGELTAADQYFTHSRMYEDWGLGVLSERIKHESEEELEHADTLIKRILFLDGTPDLSVRTGLKIGSTVAEMMANDLELEISVARELKDVIQLAEAEKDFVTREILEDMLKTTEEDHMYWLETQLELIEKIGIQNYMQSKLG
jgi:bacterioferritin|tara:strand:+ start:44 stop:517 length:474 start_codon:yes stop_codon:yes gene_type:complete